MKLLLIAILLTLCQSVHAKIGWTMQQELNEYGPPAGYMIQGFMYVICFENGFTAYIDRHTMRVIHDDSL